MFAASLVVLMNQFSSLYHTKEYAQTMADAMDIMAYCAETDSQAERVLDIIRRFSEVVTKWTKDHTYDAPELSSDLSCLYNHPESSGPPPDHSNRGPVASSVRGQGPSRLPDGQDPGLLTPPTMSKMPLLNNLSTQPPGAMAEARVSGVSSSHTHFLSASLVDSRPTVSSHSSIDGSQPFSGNFEFEFDGLWSSFINHLPPVSTVAPGINSCLASQFPPPAVGTPTEPFGGYSIPQESRVLPPARVNRHVPLFHPGFC